MGLLIKFGDPFSFVSDIYNWREGIYDKVSYRQEWKASDL